jgi:hypothetical protein
MASRSVLPSYGLPGKDWAYSTNWPACAQRLVATIETLTPNS